MGEPTQERKPRGFQTMSPAERSLIASAGGRAAHAQGKAHRYTSDEAKAAGSKGGRAVLERHGVDHMRNLGRVGGARNAERLKRLPAREEVQNAVV